MADQEFSVMVMHYQNCSLDNSSFNRYCLQQNIYKHIAETELD